MKIIARDIMTGEDIPLTATLTTDHPASSYGQPVMLIDQWEDNACMSHQNWMLSGCRVAEMDEDEQEAFARWYRLIEVMSSSLLDSKS